MEPRLRQLDLSLIAHVHRSPLKKAASPLHNDLCQEMGLGVVAEGVESPEERDGHWVGLGLDLLQGYHFCRPHAPCEPAW